MSILAEAKKTKSKVKSKGLKLYTKILFKIAILKLLFKTLMA